MALTDNPRIIHAPMNPRRLVTTSAITQYDYGYLLLPEGMELPATYEIDFSNDEKNGTSLTVYGGAEGAEVPEELIRTGKDVYAFYYRVGEGYGKTEFTWRLPNHCRPSRDGETPTPTQQSSIDQLITRSNGAVESAEQSASQADQSARSAQTYANNAQISANNASASASQAEQSAQTASAKADSITGLTATATTLPSRESATVNYNPETGVMSFGIPKGKDGINGDDGYSPTVTITPITGGHRITITDADGTETADVMDGQTPTVHVDDVQINGTSIVEDGVANVPVASSSTFGVVKATGDGGITISSNGNLQVTQASASQIKTGTTQSRIISPAKQHESTFYGLAKSAGDTTQSASSNAVGNYTDTAKGKIQTMLGIADLIGNSEGATASQAYSVGDVLLHDGKLYKVTASIAQGSAIVPDTNCTQTTIIDLLRGV